MKSENPSPFEARPFPLGDGHFLLFRHPWNFVFNFLFHWSFIVEIFIVVWAIGLYTTTRKSNA